MSRRDTHVIVLGSGAGGMAAGLAAAAAGAQVTVLERTQWLGGTTATSGAGIWIPANPWAAAAGAVDSIDDALRYLGALSLGDVDPVVGEAYVREGVGVARSLEDRAGVRWQHLVGMSDYHAEFAGGSSFGRALEIGPVEVGAEALARVRPDPYATPVWTINEEAGVVERPDATELARRSERGVATRGRGLIAALTNAIERLGGELRTSVGPVELVMAGRAVIGIDVDGGTEQLRGPVVIATGGFERDPQLVASFLRGPVLAPAGPPSNRGDGLRMGMAAGAALGNMSEAWWCSAIHVPGEEIDGAPFYRMLFLDLAKPGGLVVDRAGRRFANEATNYNDFGRTLHDLHAADFDRPRIPSWFVFDAARHGQFPLGFMAAPEPDGDWLVRADSLPALAEATGLPADALVDTVARFNDGAATGSDAFGRGSYSWDRFSSGGGAMRPLGGSPFYAARVLPGCLGTKGGLRIDPRGRVAAADGASVIDGLFAAGNTAANPFGCAYPGPGATVGPALVFGTLAGETAAGG
ncbi:MAG: FAD-binding protein [Ilumatobacteraceae bacterium]